MLSLYQIQKSYQVGDTEIPALRGVSLHFRKSEFVSVLGPSGCGKTTLLNIIGGLDQYTNGDLVINGKSTRDFRNGEWDHYRNHSVGFVFQSYNLIGHQTVLSNVELALTLSGVSKEERRKRAIAALEQVGLGDQLQKKPNQMSGGQMQRVAIARALVNDPDIILADEPTGALDSATSVQIMEILKEISHNKLIVMVTHNPEIAEQYSTRIVRLLDGELISDTNPYDPTIENSEPTPVDLVQIAPDEETAKQLRKNKKKRKQDKNASMSFRTALSLSLNNLLTKKGRTLMVSFAGSIGIIGIALILAVSNGIHAYIQRVQEDTLSSYPITITESAMDLGAMMGAMQNNGIKVEDQDPNKVYTNATVQQMLGMITSGYTENDLEAFKQHLDSNREVWEEHITDIQYLYTTTMHLYTTMEDGTVKQVNPSTVFAFLMKSLGMSTDGMGGMMTSTDVFAPLVGDQSFWEKQYEVLEGRFPQAYNEVVIFVDENNRVSDYMLYSLGLLDENELTEMIKANLSGTSYTAPQIPPYAFSDFTKLEYTLLLNSDYYSKNALTGYWEDRSDDAIYVSQAVKNSTEKIKVVGVIKPAEGAVVSTTGAVCYRPDLMEHLITLVNNSEVVKEQKNSPDTDIFSGKPFESGETKTFTMAELQAMIAMDPTNPTMQALQGMITKLQGEGQSDEQIAATISQMMTSQNTTDATYSGNLAALGVSDLSKPFQINIYPKDFESKEFLSEQINAYNESATDADKITYTDYIGLMLSSVSAIVTGVSTVLICFVGISLVVSSIMIGIITYISVLERTKEIGILRAIGASKKDISRVFNAETLIIGFAAGLFGIIATLILTIPINMIIQGLTDLNATAMLSVWNALILVGISMLLTMIAGLIPAGMAAKKDPVIALRSE